MLTNKLNSKIIIAIDGFSSTGKSTLAKQLAAALNYIYVDTGAMYRAVTLFALRNGIIDREHFDPIALIARLPDIKIGFQYNAGLGFAEVYLNDFNVEEEIRTIEVSSYVSRIAEISAVRTKLVEQQKRMGAERGIVMDGRDIGTVVFPDAELKIFMTASPETRARRRYDELRAKGQIVSFEEILANVQERDFIDSHRDDSPLVKAGDAIEIDNSNLTREEQFDRVMALASEVINRKQINR